MVKKLWNPNVSVIVCGVENSVVTSTGSGSQTFNNLMEAQDIFPDLDPKEHTKRFTWAMGDSEKDVMRFETWKANELYSR